MIYVSNIQTIEFETKVIPSIMIVFYLQVKVLITIYLVGRINQSPTNKCMVYPTVVYLDSKSIMLNITSFTPC